MSGILELRDVHRVHGSGETAVQALRGVTLTVTAGELVAGLATGGRCGGSAPLPALRVTTGLCRRAIRGGWCRSGRREPLGRVG